MINYRDFIIDMVNEGQLDAKDVLITCLKYMSIDDVKDMIEYNYLDVDGGLDDWKELNQEAA